MESNKFNSDSKVDSKIIDNDYVSLSGAIKKTTLAPFLKRNKGRTPKGVRRMQKDGTTFSTISEGLPCMAIKPVNNKIYRYVQMFEAASAINSSAVAFVNYGAYFDTTLCSQFSTFSALYDQYKLEKVEVWIVPRNPTSNTGNGVFRGQLYSVIDYDDATALSGPTAYEQYQNVIIAPANLGQYRVFQPHTAQASYNGSGVFTGYANVTNAWIDVASTTVQYYGLKVGVSQADATADTTQFDLTYRLHWAFRNVR